MAQESAQTTRVTTAPTVDRSTSTDWPLHNLDLQNTRFARVDQITSSNVGSLVLKWSHQMPPREIIRSATPLVIDGIMYFNSGSKLTALNAMTGETVWTFEGDPKFSGGGRGPAYGDGKIYAFGPTIMYAVDAKTGELVESFGDNGLLEVAREALTFKYPDTYPPTVDTTAMGFAMTNPPTFTGGNLFIGLPFSEGLLPGGLLVSVDGTTGAMRWVFNTIPQGPQDEGWEIAKDTWSTDERYGGGWYLDAAIGRPRAWHGLLQCREPVTELRRLIEIGARSQASSCASDASSGVGTGMNLFTNSMMAVDMNTGEPSRALEVVRTRHCNLRLPRYLGLGPGIRTCALRCYD